MSYRESEEEGIRKSIVEVIWSDVTQNKNYTLKKTSLNELCIQWGRGERGKVWVYAGGYTGHRDIEAMLGYNCNMLYCMYISIDRINRYLSRLNLNHLALDESRMFILSKEKYESSNNPLIKTFGAFFVRDWVLEGFGRFDVIKYILEETPVYKGKIGSPYMQILYEVGLYVYVQLVLRYKAQRERTGRRAKAEVLMEKEEFIRTFINYYYWEVKKLNVTPELSNEEIRNKKEKLKVFISEMVQLGGRVPLMSEPYDRLRKEYLTTKHYIDPLTTSSKEEGGIEKSDFYNPNKGESKAYEGYGEGFNKDYDPNVFYRESEKRLYDVRKECGVTFKY